MKPIVVTMCGVLCAALLLALPRATAAIEPAEVAAAIKRSADWQLANPSGTETRDWIIAPLYDGLLRTSLATGDPKYMAAVIRMGKQAGWLPANRIYHADDHAVGHAWLDVFLLDKTREERLAPIRDRLSYVIANPVTEELAHGQKPKTKGVSVSDRWSWCDALYMAPPTLTRLFTATGDRKYLDFLDREFRYTYDHLYDPESRLFFRDATFLDKKTPNGSKTFWSRGNGWVYGGLALMLEHLPKDHPSRDFYEKIFKDMTTMLLAVQQPSGLWHPSLLDAGQINVGETSGSGFFTFGLAWGIRNGLLDREKHLPALERAWAGLMTRTRPDGHVGYVQPVGAAPDVLTPEATQDYGTGAFLLAGSEILALLDAGTKEKPAAILAAAEKLIAADTTPRAYARLVPERKDDLAWENDKVAFRVYGPALRESAEDSGIDVWCKRVARPIIDKWYEQDLTRKISYHKDHGEGLDDYKVGDTRGCGGIGLWVDGKIVTSDTYLSAEILWTSPNVAEFHTVYQYPLKVDGKPLLEYRVTRLRLGERLTDFTSTFSTKSGQRFRNVKSGINIPHEIAIGLTTQRKDAKVTFSAEHGLLAIYESLAGKGFGTGVRVHPDRVVRSENIPAADEAGNNAQALIIVRPDDNGRVTWRAGFAWAADGEITTADQWLEYLKRTAVH